MRSIVDCFVCGVGASGDEVGGISNVLIEASASPARSATDLSEASFDCPSPGKSMTENPSLVGGLVGYFIDMPSTVSCVFFTFLGASGVVGESEETELVLKG